MKKIFLSVVTIIVLMGLFLSIPTPTQAGQLYRFKGTGADAYWFSYDEDTGVCTDIFVSGHDTRSQSPPGRPQGKEHVSIQIFQYRYDGGEFVPLINVSCWGYIPPGCLVLDHKLATASLSASGLEGWKFDYLGDLRSTVTLDVEVSWIATGPLNRTSYKWRQKLPDGIYKYRYTGRNRGAVAQGNLCYDGTSIILGASNGATIFSAKEGFIEISR